MGFLGTQPLSMSGPDQDAHDVPKRGSEEGKFAVGIDVVIGKLATSGTSTYRRLRDADRIDLGQAAPIFTLKDTDTENEVALARLHGPQIDQDIPMCAHPLRNGLVSTATHWQRMRCVFVLNGGLYCLRGHGSSSTGISCTAAADTQVKGRSCQSAVCSLTPRFAALPAHRRDGSAPVRLQPAFAPPRRCGCPSRDSRRGGIRVP